MDDVRNQLLREELNQSNYVQPLRQLKTAFEAIAEVFVEKSNAADIEEFVKLKRIAKKYQGHATRINDLFLYKFDHSFEYNEQETKITIKPIFVGNMSNKIMTDYNLFMSATISPDFMRITMELDKGETAFVGLDPVYDPENKQIIFCGNKKLSYYTMKEPDTIQYLQDVVREVVSNANDDGYKGLMLTPSFAVGETLSKAVYDHQKNCTRYWSKLS